MSESSIGEIHIYITDNEVKYETEMSLPEIVFWAEAIKQMAIRNVLIEGRPDIDANS